MEHHLEYLIKKCIEHYNTEKPHQALDNEIIKLWVGGKGEIVYWKAPN